MKTTKIIVLAGCVIGALLFLGAGFVLYRGVVQFGEARDDLEDAKLDLGRYYEAKVFPSESNVNRERDNTKQVDLWFKELVGELCKGNVISDERSPSKFIGVFESVQRRLVKEARKAGTVLPDPADSFSFGFGQYSGTGTLPKPTDVPRLTEQLVIVNRLALILFNNRVKTVTKIEREAFEQADQSADSQAGESRRDDRRRDRRSDSRRDRDRRKPTASASVGDAGRIRAGELYARMHFVLEFRAKQSALLDILNALAAHPMFIVVTSVSLSKPTPELVPVIAEEESEDSRAGFGGELTSEKTAEAPKLGPKYPVCGIKMEIPLDVRLELDVYKFREATLDSGD
jgi:hypothetical protein